MDSSARVPYVLFPIAVASGAAALIYELVWFQTLELALGSTAVSLTVILATFMGGSAVGSALSTRLRRPSPLRLYAALEMGIALCGVLAPIVMPLVGRLNADSTVAPIIAAALCLLPPTFLMGATLPVLARVVDDAAQVGYLYTCNLVGAVAGCFAAGFYLLRLYDTSVASYVAALLNITAAGAAFVASRDREGAPSRTADPASRATITRRVQLVIALSGFCALAAESVWTRTLGLLFGASVYTLAIVLAVFLCGLGAGGGLGSLICKTTRTPLRALGLCQLFSVAALAWTCYTLNASLPYWPINPASSASVWVTFPLDLDRAFWALLPPTLLWGASFPLALAAARRSDERVAFDVASAVPGIYNANTIGAVLGAITAVALVPMIGSQGAERVLIAAAGLAALAALGLNSRALAVPALAALAIFLVPELPALLIAHGRFAPSWIDKAQIPFAAEGLDSSVAVSIFPDGTRTFHVAGKIQASSAPRDLRLQRMLGHLTTLAADNPASVLVIGCGAGITAGAAATDPRVKSLTIAEIERLVPRASAEYFPAWNFDVLRDPRTHVHFDDGRHYLFTTRDRFDAITVDPLDPWVKGAANLYTREFYQAAKAHLNPGGTVTMYIQLFETDLDAVKSALATFFEAFPNGTAWGNPYNGKGHDMVLLGRVEPLHIDLDALEERLRAPAYDRFNASLAEVGINSSSELFATYAGRASDLRPWLHDAAINRDSNLRMQYLAGLGLNLDDAASIYAHMLAYRRFPDDLFQSSEGRSDSVRGLMNRAAQ